ncbi:MAG TPA: hypothetical protein VE129_11190 [Thermoanaerobaculia bacterium]|nr:hypothetical protein [Thermoanaerobaculia bacterium]
MRRDVSGIGMRIAEMAVLLFATLLPGVGEAGLRLVPDGGVGADVRAFSQSFGVVWTGTASGVFRSHDAFSSGVLDGLSGQPVSSLAILGGEVWAATGETLWRRGVGGSWSEVTLPSPAAFPTTVAVDSSGTLWVGGLGAWRRTGETWTAAPSPGVGLVLSMLPDPQGLVVGLSTGSAARWNGSGWSVYSSGVGSSEGFQALASFGGTLWAGTNVTLYSWSGSTWVADPAFGRHDVRALTMAGGVFRVATADAGVRARNGSTWASDSSGILPRGAQAFLEIGSELFVGTNGGPVYRRRGSAWETNAGPYPAAVMTDAAPIDSATFGAGAIGVTHGGGAEFLLLPTGGGPGIDPPDLSRLPDGCGDATAVAKTASATMEALVTTNCGPFLVTEATVTPATGGLATQAVPTTLASHSSTVYGGTAGSGLLRLSGTSWSRELAFGDKGTGTVNAVRSFGGGLWAAMVEGLYVRGSGPWTNVSAGLPSAGLVASLGGDATTAFAGLATGGVYRRPAGGEFLKDSAGLNSNAVLSLDVAGRRLWAAAGGKGVAVKRDGGWALETSGLPPGASVTLVRGAGGPGAGGQDSDTLLVGTAGHGAWRADIFSSARTLPVVLDVVGSGGARFLSELVIGSRAAADLTLSIWYAPAPGFAGPGGTLESRFASLTISAGREIRAADALTYLRSLGMSIPVATADSPVAGSVTLSWQTAGKVDDTYLIARTYTRSASGGTFGLFYGAPSDLDAAEGEATVYGLRSLSGDSRSNLAAVHVPGRGTEAIEVSVQVYAENGAPAGSPLVRTLAPGEWTQWNGVLGLAGLPDGSYGYARIRRTAGVGAFTAYGVVNDAKTSDGSYLPAFRPGGLAAARTVIVPVVLDVYGEAGSHYTTEVTLVNDGAIATPVDLVYRPAPGFGEIGGVPVVTVELAARQQVTIPDVLAYLRSHGMQIPDGTTAAQAGTLTATFRYLTVIDAPSTVVLARTTTPNTDAATGGAFGLFYTAVAKGGGARTSALVPGLAQDDDVRSNLAVVNTGGGSELPITLEVRLYDADTGAAAGSPLTVRLAVGDWVQWSRVHALAGAPASVKRFTAVVRRIAGDDTFVAYGVLNDAVTSDGSYQTMVSSDPY